MKTKKKKARPLPAVLTMNQISDEEFIGPLKEKSAEELRQLILENWGLAYTGLYEIMRSLRAMELSGKFKDLGHKTFKEALSKIIGMSESAYWSYLKVARRFPRELIERTGFPVLAAVIRKKLSPSSQDIIREKIERTVEATGQLPPRSEIKEIIAKLAPPAEKDESQFRKANFLEKEIKELRKQNLELKRTLRNKEEEIQKLKISLEDERRYREELQKGKRAI